MGDPRSGNMADGLLRAPRLAGWQRGDCVSQGSPLVSKPRSPRRAYRMLFGRAKCIGLAIGLSSAFALCRSANAAETAKPPAPAPAPSGAKSVEEVAKQRGFLYYPAAPPAGKMR